MRQWLKEIRKSQRYSQREIAEISGISQTYYSAIETGHRGINVKTAMKIAKALDFPWVWFYRDIQDRIEGANE